MYVNEPNGKNYLEVTLDNDLVKIKLLKYDNNIFVSLDKRCIPDLISALNTLCGEENVPTRD